MLDGTSVGSHESTKHSTHVKNPGIPFNDTNWRLTIAEKGQAILGDHLIGLQAGNEPDYYLG